MALSRSPHTLLLLLFSLYAAAPRAVQAAVGTAVLGQGNLGGACGFKGFPTGGAPVAGFSKAIYGNGLACGGCYKLSCYNSKLCHKGATVTVTIANLCQAENASSPCVLPKAGINLQPATYDLLVSSRSSGNFPVVYTQVPCVRTGGVQLTILTGQQYYLAILFQNVAGPGELSSVEIAVGAGAFQPMGRSYGAVWDKTGLKAIGKGLSFRLTGNGGQKLVLYNVIPATWGEGAVYQSGKNFPVGPAPKPKPKPKPTPRPPAPAANWMLGNAVIGQGYYGGACGYRSFPPASVFQAGFSEQIYGKGAACGGCYKVLCYSSKYCIKGSSVTVTVTNLCQALNASSVCVLPKKGLNLQPGAFDKIVSSRSVGSVPVMFAAVPCSRTGGVQFSPVVQAAYYVAILVQNVAGPGRLGAVYVAAGAGPFKAMSRSYGSVWELRNVNTLGKALSFKLVAYTGAQLVTYNIVPANAALKSIYSSSKNFA